jgi:hypothetical protein
MISTVVRCCTDVNTVRGIGYRGNEANTLRLDPEAIHSMKDIQIIDLLLPARVYTLGNTSQ